MFSKYFVLDDILQLVNTSLLPNFTCNSFLSDIKSGDNTTSLATDCKYDNTILQQYVQTLRSPREKHFLVNFNIQKAIKKT
jgi:hypothetical protein